MKINTSIVKSINIFFLIVVFFVLSCASGEKAIINKNTKKIYPPVALKKPDTLIIHNNIIVDNYSWLKDKSREKKEVIDYIKAENEYAEMMLNHTDKLQDTLFKEIISRLPETELTVPVKKGNYYYYWKKLAGEQYSIYCRKKDSLKAKEEIILDINRLAKGKEFYNILDVKVSPDNRYLAYTVDTTGTEFYKIYIKDLKNNMILKDTAYPVSDVVWANDCKTLFYIKDNANGRSYKLFRHFLFTDPNQDKLIYHEKDPAFYLWIYKSRSKEYIILCSGSKTTSEIRFLKADNPTSSFELVTPRQHNHKYYICPHEDSIYIVTNCDDHENNQIMITSAEYPGRDNWKLVIPENVSVKIELDVFKDYLVIHELEKGLEKLKIKKINSDSTYYINFPDSLYTYYTWSSSDFYSDTLRYTYESLTTPYSVIDYNMTTRIMYLKKQKEVGKDYNSMNYFSKRVYATAKDSVQIPISIVYKKDLFKKDGSNPLILYGYGSYGDIYEPYFSITRLSLLDRGFIYAVAHVRGGGEMGEKWYENGKMLRKKNTFTDYITCAEYLIKEKYTNPQKLVASGSSAGGLLVGAVVNIRPDLFEVIVADVPFVDIINTMLDTTLSAVFSEYEEWGNPRIKEIFEYIYSYSPYDNVKKQEYPNMLILSGFYDTRVNFWEQAKWTAKLRDLKTDDNIILLMTNMAGHGGMSGRYDYFKEIALEYAFVIDMLK